MSDDEDDLANAPARRRQGLPAEGHGTGRGGGRDRSGPSPGETVVAPAMTAEAGQTAAGRRRRAADGGPVQERSPSASRRSCSTSPAG
ncbi:MAG: hypothetical protein MZW92_79030 [Comamonadaceae bacterium]|nr:hypothetical protein [Comamonadaceae bacterium]